MMEAASISRQSRIAEDGYVMAAARQITDLQTENERLRNALLTWADNVERDRREPDKMLCAVQSMRRAANRA